MVNDPAFLLYSKDWIQGTAQMSPEEKGVYIDLLAHQHQENGLPTDTKRLARLVHLPHTDFLNIWEFLAQKFTEQDGKLFNKKLQKVMSGRSEHSAMRKIIGTFGGLIKDFPVSDFEKQQIRKDFDYNIFTQTPAEELSKSISIWLSKYLPFGEANDGNENEDGNEDCILGIGNEKKTFLQFPKPENFNGLPEIKIGSAIQLIKITQKVDIKSDEILAMWGVFKDQNLTGKKFYQDENAVYQHFTNWVKTQKFNNGTEFKPTKQTRVDALKNW